ncbi:MAG: ComF family protein [Alphaproteobacteria bacterium]|nr:ComF family protein [Alphaproteobacteria bacterium]
MFKMIFEDLLNFLFPYQCLRCGKILNKAGYLCDECVDEINFITAPYCHKCGHPLQEENVQDELLCGGCSKKKHSFYRFARSAVVYDNSSKNLILAFKFFDQTENSALLAAMLKIAGKDIFEAGADLLVPVPLHYTRLIKRRYNQSALLVQKLSKMTDIPYDNFSLIRKRRTKPQVEVSGKERATNVKNAFEVKYPQNVKGRRIILVDDIMTTGSTVKESALALKRAGAKSVDILTIARTI